MQVPVVGDPVCMLPVGGEPPEESSIIMVGPSLQNKLLLELLEYIFPAFVAPIVWHWNILVFVFLLRATSYKTCHPHNL